MDNRSNGAMYVPEGSSQPVVPRGAFKVGAIGLDHGHIFGMNKGLQDAGATISKVYDPDPEKVAAFLKAFPEAVAADGKDEILTDPEIKLVSSAAIPSTRFGIGMEVLDAGKDFFSDKPPFTSQEQVTEARRKVKETGLRWFVYYSERLHVEAAVFAERLINDGAIGRVVEIRGWGPHRLSLFSRPAWFFEKDKYGGILTDIGSHQLEQMLFYTGAKDAKCLSSRVGNLNHPEHPGLEDFGDATFITDNGVPCYVNVDWFTPDGLGTWGDGRLLVVGTKGYIELRKYTDVARSNTPGHVILVDEKEERHFEVAGKVGFPYFGRMILDCLNRTETAISQEHIFRAIELAIEAQRKAINITRA